MTRDRQRPAAPAGPPGTRLHCEARRAGPRTPKGKWRGTWKETEGSEQAWGWQEWGVYGEEVP